MRGWLLAVPLLCFGCAGSFEEVRGTRPRLSLAPLDYCQSLDAMHRNWGAVEKGAAFVAGASGVAMIPVGDDKAARIGLASAVVGAGALAVVAGFESQSAATGYVEKCQ